MEQEKIITEQEQKQKDTPVDPTTEDMIKTIEELKANRVDKAAYEKVLEDNRKLLNSIVKGESLKQTSEEENSVDLDELRNDLFNKDNSNLEYARKALELRDALIAKGEVDPFLPNGNQIAPTSEDIAASDRVAEALKSCIEYADGDSEVFTNELQRIMVDSGPRRRR